MLVANSGLCIGYNLAYFRFWPGRLFAFRQEDIGDNRQAQVVVITPGQNAYDFNTSASLNGATSSSMASWAFTNDKKQAVFSGSASLYNQGDPVVYGTLARAATSVRFTLTETVDYAISGTFNGILNPDTGTIPGNLAGQQIYADIGGPVATHPSGFIYAGSSDSSSSGLLSLPAIGDVGFPSGGPHSPLAPTSSQSTMT